jgi:hypothetical protein
MTINARMLITALFLIGLTPLWAQNQRLTWEGDEYAMRYEVIIEQEEAVKYHRVLREFTEDFFIEISLPSGKYRCQVIPYDFLNQPVPVTEWMDFEVLSGNHEIILVNEIPSAAPEAEKIIEYKNPFDIYLGAAWVPLVPIYQDSKTDFDESKSFGANGIIAPIGVGVRFNIVSAKQRLFNPGMESTASWRIYKSDSGENVQSILFDCNMIEQYRFIDNRTALNLRLGAGVSLVSNGDSLWAIGHQYSTHFNIGASLLCLISKNFFLETGMEYSQLFLKDFFCFFRSWIGLGYKF